MAVEGIGISAEELVRRVREEVQRRPALRTKDHPSSRALPVNGTATDLRAIDDAIAAARERAVAGMDLPPMTARRGVSRRIAVPIARAILRVARLVMWSQNAFNHAVVTALQAVAEASRNDGSRLAAMRDELASRMADVVTEASAQGQVLDVRLTSLQAESEQRLAGLQRELAAANETIAALRNDALARSTDLANRIAADHAATVHLRTQLLLQERRVSLLLEESRSRPPARDVAGEAPASSTELDHLLDTFYVSFEDHFRGTREDIKERARPYVRTIREAGAGVPGRPVLDLGCGRGEWLELLRDEGLEARGLDNNHAMAEETRGRGFEVIEEDALAYLRRLPDASVGAVTGFHILEHVPFPTLVRILDESVRVLKPGGVAIFETPNPKNLVVGSCQFYVDPTHRNPLHPETMAFLAEARGLNRVTAEQLHPVDECHHFPEDSSLARRLNEYFFGPQDFAVVGYRP